MMIGFTGTRNGMTEKQYQVFCALLHELKPTEFHHGDCVGADDQAATEAGIFHGPVKVICHPPLDEKLRAYNKAHEAGGTLLPPLTHFARNRKIVDACTILIATPYENEPQQQGGTWYTVSYARKQGKRVIIIYPDGRVER